MDNPTFWAAVGALASVGALIMSIVSLNQRKPDNPDNTVRPPSQLLYVPPSRRSSRNQPVNTSHNSQENGCAVASVLILVAFFLFLMAVIFRTDDPSSETIATFTFLGSGFLLCIAGLAVCAASHRSNGDNE